MDRFDVIIIGMGVGGEAAAGRLLAAGRRVAVIERELIGGECAYWARIPSKTLLRGPEVRPVGRACLLVLRGPACRCGQRPDLSAASRKGEIPGRGAIKERFRAS